MTDGWSRALLGDLCTIDIGKTPPRAVTKYWGPDHPWLSIADMGSNRLLRESKETITDAAVTETGCRLVEPGTVLLSFKLSVGKVGVAGIPLYTNEAIAHLPILDHSILDRDYLYWALRSADLTGRVDRAAMGSTLNKAKLSEISLPLPPIEEQRRIAAVLDQADELRARRRASLALLDSVTESIFLDMFGDPIANIREWAVVKLGELGSLDRGVSRHRPRNDPALLGGCHPLIQTGDVANSGGYITRYSATYSDAGLRQSKMWPAGTLCITIAANIARTGILTFNACFPDSVVGFTARDNGTVEYVRWVLRFFQRQLEDAAPESAQKNINLRILRDLPVPNPPRALIAKFGDLVDAAVATTHTLRRASTQLDALFASLQYRAFAGQL